jgi:F0F1-type ATP synthase epsilon subunit
VSALRLRVLTPEATVFDESVAEVVAPLPDGWIGILPGHTAFEARLMPGQIVVRLGGGDRAIATCGGTLSVDRAGATALVGAAAVGRDLSELEREIGEQARELAEIESEAERHFDRIYREVARTLNYRA